MFQPVHLPLVKLTHFIKKERGCREASTEHSRKGQCHWCPSQGWVIRLALVKPLNCLRAFCCSSSFLALLLEPLPLCVLFCCFTALLHPASLSGLCDTNTWLHGPALSKSKPVYTGRILFSACPVIEQFVQIIQAKF